MSLILKRICIIIEQIIGRQVSIFYLVNLFGGNKSLLMGSTIPAYAELGQVQLVLFLVINGSETFCPHRKMAIILFFESRSLFMRIIDFQLQPLKHFLAKRITDLLDSSIRQGK